MTTRLQDLYQDGQTVNPLGYYSHARQLLEGSNDPRLATLDRLYGALESGQYDTDPAFNKYLEATDKYGKSIVDEILPNRSSGGIGGALNKASGAVSDVVTPVMNEAERGIRKYAFTPEVVDFFEKYGPPLAIAAGSAMLGVAGTELLPAGTGAVTTGATQGAVTGGAGVGLRSAYTGQAATGEDWLKGVGGGGASGAFAAGLTDYFKPDVAQGLQAPPTGFSPTDGSFQFAGVDTPGLTMSNAAGPGLQLPAAGTTAPTLSGLELAGNAGLRGMATNTTQQLITEGKVDPKDVAIAGVAGTTAPLVNTVVDNPYVAAPVIGAVQSTLKGGNTEQAGDAALTSLAGSVAGPVAATTTANYLRDKQTDSSPPSAPTTPQRPAWLTDQALAAFQRYKQPQGGLGQASVKQSTKPWITPQALQTYAAWKASRGAT